MTDQISTIGASVVQHGKYNDRVYLMKLALQDSPAIIDAINRLATQQGYSKIFAKLPAHASEPFLADGYRIEATIPGFFQEDAACLLGKYFNEQRMAESNPELVHDVLQTALSQPLAATRPLPAGLVCRMADQHDADAMAALYRLIFASYPFPITDPDYLRACMRSTVFFGIWADQKLVALSSAEIDQETSSVEMTDFATLEAYRGHGLARYLLQQMEQEMVQRGIVTWYTIARACSRGMNNTFAKSGYGYAGTLTNNTQISGGLESMNVWYKRQPNEPAGDGTAAHD